MERKAVRLWPHGRSGDAKHLPKVFGAAFHQKAAV